MLTKEKLKFNPALERQARRWIEAVLGEELSADQTLMQALRTGAVLCRVVQRLLPNQIIKINERNQAYNHRVRTAGTLTPRPSACADRVRRSAGDFASLGKHRDVPEGMRPARPAVHGPVQLGRPVRRKERQPGIVRRYRLATISETFLLIARSSATGLCRSGVEQHSCAGQARQAPGHGRACDRR